MSGSPNPILIPTSALYDAAQRWLAIKHPELVGRRVRIFTVEEGLAIEVVESKETPK